MDRAQEAELLRLAQRGDDAARETLYRVYFAGSKQIKGLLAREVRNPEDREDVLHDAYISLVRSSSQFRGESALQTFVYRVVQTTILQKLRSERSRRQDKMVRLSFDFEGEQQERQLAIEDYQFEQVDAESLRDRLLEFLPEPLRAPFRLRVSDELSYEEIASRTGTPVNTVATRIFKARALLAGLFGAPKPDAEPGHTQTKAAKKGPGRSI